MGVRVLPPQPEKTINTPVPNNSLTELNSSQIEAVTHREGPLLVLAGPGSGKTRVIAYRIAYLINEFSVPPEQILAVTFTNKAAAEMKKRARDLVGGLADRIWIGTFHSICLRILKTEADSLEGYTKDFVVYDRDDQLGLLKSCLKELDYGAPLFSSPKVLSEFDLAENGEGVFFEEGFYGRRLGDLYGLYKERLIERNAMTFNDLLIVSNKLLSGNPEVCGRYQQRFSQVLIDEYQDTNISQYLLAKTLSARHCNLFAVGDDSQAIYGWRGADITNILNFEKDFAGAKVVKLEQNYRSTRNILGIANSVIKESRDRKEKNLWTANPEGEKAVVLRTIDNHDEAWFVAQRISRLVESGDFAWSDIAVFYRANFQSRVIEQGFRAAKIPYRIVSGVGFYQRAEIKDVIAYLRLAQNPRDEASFLRIVNVPPRKIGQATIERLREEARAGGFSIFEAAQYCTEHGLLSPQALRALSRFLEIIEDLGSAAQNRPVSGVINSLLESTGYLDYLGDHHQRVENVKELLSAAREYGYITLSDFLDIVSLATDEDRADSGEGEVSLMTIHAAKGLEFSAVFLIGVNEGSIPHFKAAETLEGIEEERRLFYVAVTRAKRFLHLSYTSLASGSPGMSDPRMSEFLNDLLEEHVVYESSKKEPSGRNSRNGAASGLPGTASRKGLPGGRSSRRYSDSPSKKDAPGLPAAASNLKPGKRVTHNIFGPGVVKGIEKKGDREIATVDFFGSGVKKIVSTFLAD